MRGLLRSFRWGLVKFQDQIAIMLKNGGVFEISFKNV